MRRFTPSAFTPWDSSMRSFFLTSPGLTCSRAGMRIVLITASTGARCCPTPGTHVQRYCHSTWRDEANPWYADYGYLPATSASISFVPTHSLTIDSI